VRVAAFGDVHANAEALDAVFAAAVDTGADELWCLGDLVGSGPDAARVVAMVRAYCRVAMAGNHDYVAAGAGSVRADAFGPPGSFARRSLAAAADALAASGDLEWLRSRRPAARRHGVRCWHGSPRNPVREYVGAANAAACLERQAGPLGLVAHTHEAAAWHAVPGGGAERVPIVVGEALDVSAGRWLLNPGAAGAPFPVRGDWWTAMEEHAGAGAWWLDLDLAERTATWRRAPFDPAPGRERARALGLVDEPAAAGGTT
jgi:calcineurin-like phosphoesterase family protein